MSHYSIHNIKKEEGMSFLKEVFPSGEADDLNFVLFSTSGVHGFYTTIEQAEKEIDENKDVSMVTFLLIKPRMVSVIYGNVIPKTMEDIVFLKKLRETSSKAMQTIGF